MEQITRLSFVKKLAFLVFLIAFSNLTIAQVRINSTNYPNLREAFNGINAGHYVGQNIVIEITGNTTESEKSEITFNTPSYQSITIRPSGTGSRSITFPAGVAESIVFRDAHDITIDGNNKQLVIVNHNGYRAIQFYNTDDVILKDCWIAGHSNGGMVYIGGASENCQITGCRIGSVNYLYLPQMGIEVQGGGINGSPTNITIENNLITDYGHSPGSVNITSGAISLTMAGSFKIKSNRMYQSFAHPSRLIYPIYLGDMNNNVGNASEISNNIIGGQASEGLYPVTNEKCLAYNAIRYSGSAAFTVKIDENIISDISVEGIDWETSTNHDFTGINIIAGSATITNNTIGSVISTGKIKDYSNNTGETTIFGIKTARTGKFTITSNFIGGFEAYTPATSIPIHMYGINVGYAGEVTGNNQQMTCSNNYIGADVPLSFRNDSQHADSSVTGISTTNQFGPISSNTIQNLSSYGVTNGVVGIERILFVGANGAKPISANTIYNLHNANGSGASQTIGIKQDVSVSTDSYEIERNFIYGLTSASSNASSQVVGIDMTHLPSRVLNNMISLTGDTAAAQVTGIKSDYSTASFTQGHFENNSVYIGGTQSVGNAPSSAFHMTGTTNIMHKIYNNIFVNNRTVSGSSTAPRYDIFYSPNYTNFRDLKNNLFADPHFIAPSGTPPNLHIDPIWPTLVEARGFTDAGFHPTVDFDNQTRSSLTPVDIGADAGNFIKIENLVIDALSATDLCTNWYFNVTGTGLSTVTEAKIGSTVMNISSISDTSLTIETGTAALSGTLQLTYPVGTVTHPTAINIYTPPTITQQPNSLTVCPGAPTSFSVAATDAVTYQWRWNGSDIGNDGTFSGTNTPTLSISNASLALGSYEVEIMGTANACRVVSAAVGLSVNVLPLPVISASGTTNICQNGSVTLSTNYNGPAIQFNGGNQYFDFPRQFLGDFTIEYWVRTTQTGNTGSNWYNGQGIVDATSSTVNDFGTSLVGNKLAFGVGNYVGFGTYASNTIISNTVINTGQWIHVAVTRSTAGQLRMYINGVLDIAGNTALNAGIATPNLRVGGKQNGGNFFNGAIDDLRVWPYVRTQNQIRSGMSHSYPTGTVGLNNNFTLNENGGSGVTNIITGQMSALPNGAGWTTRATTSNYLAYQWSNGATTPTITVNTAGNYSVIVTDANGCTGTNAPMAVTVQSISATTAATICVGSSTVLSASGAVSYSWSPSTGLNTTVGPSVTANPTQTTTYTVSGQMASGCISTKQVTVTVIPAITLSASQLFVTPGGSATLTASGSTGYTWSPATGLDTTSGAAVIATPTQTTTYTVTPATCGGNTRTITVTVLPEPSAGNNVLDFDGNDDYVSIPVQASAVTGNFTVEAWVKPTQATKRMHVLSTRNGGEFSFDIQLRDGNKIHGDIGDGTSWLTTTADANFNYAIDEWLHIVYVVTPGNYRVYANGNLVGIGSFTGTAMLYAGTRFMTIGRNTGENTYFQGTMDNIRIYNAPLDPAQITSNMQGNYATSGLLAHYDFNRGVPGGNNAGITTLPDSNIPGNFHGTLHNFALFGDSSNWVGSNAITPQSITFNPLANVVYGDSFNPTATASSGLGVSYTSSNPNVADVSNGVIFAYGAGTTEITATQQGNGTYMPAIPVVQTLTVIPRTITMSGAFALNKAYDRTTAATIIPGILDGILGTDDVNTGTSTGIFDSADVGNNIPVTGQLTLVGESAGNYILQQPIGLSANINKKSLTITNAAANDKPYDGTTAATISGTLSGIISPDVVVIASNAGVFSSPNPGTDIPVTAQMTLGGASVGNYRLTQPTGLSADITATTLSTTFTGTATICFGESTMLQVNIAASPGTYTVQYTDGSQIVTLNNYVSGSNIPVWPTSATTYTLVSVTNANATADLSGILPVTVTVLSNTTYYADADGDGFGNLAVSQASCTGAPAGFVSNDTDCNDTDNTVWQSGTFYADADQDGYTSGATEIVCYGASVPAGYLASLTAIDCNDALTSVHPNAVEIPFNGIDDNCNGSIDETGTVTTTLIPASCGSTLASLGSLIGIQTLPVSHITGYRIRVTNGSEVQVLEKTVPHFTITQFPSYAYATTYTVDIQLQRAGIWQASWGATCLVSTPAILEEGGAASVSPSQCGITLPKINTLIATTSLAGVTGYRFRVTNLTDPLGPNAVQTIDRTQNWFSLPMLTRYNYGSLYRIEVAVKTTGAFGGFGSPCEVSSPAVPSLVNCGGIVASGTATIAATSVEGATQYRFQIVRQSDNASTTIDRSQNWFIFNSVPASAFTAGALYTVRVAVMTKGTWSPFGDACEITAPGALAKGGNTAGAEASVSDVFKATAYPNPYTADFSLDVITSSKENVQLQVYDMLGKLIETREVKFAELDMTKVGAQYPSGVYNVIVSQGDEIRVLRVIRR